MTASTPRLSIVIPTLVGGAQLEDTLVSVLQHRPRSCEVLVAHSGCYDDPYDLGDEVRFVRMEGKSSLATCARTAVATAKGEIVHLLASGALVDEGWTDAAIARFDDPHMGAVAPLILSTDEDAQSSIAGIRYRSGGSRVEVTQPLSQTPDRLRKKRVLGPHFSAAFYRRSAIELVGGIPGDVGDRLIDVALGLTLQAAGFSAAIEPDCSVGFGQTAALPRVGFTAGFHAERVFWRNAARRGWLKSLALHPLTVGVSVAREFPHPTSILQLLGRFAGFMYWAVANQRHKNATFEGQQAEPVILSYEQQADQTAIRDDADALPRRRSA
jgi:hypothetical protein